MKDTHSSHFSARPRAISLLAAVVLTITGFHTASRFAASTGETLTSIQETSSGASSDRSSASMSTNAVSGTDDAYSSASESQPQTSSASATEEAADVHAGSGFTASSEQSASVVSSASAISSDDEIEKPKATLIDATNRSLKFELIGFSAVSNRESLLEKLHAVAVGSGGVEIPMEIGIDTHHARTYVSLFMSDSFAPDTYDVFLRIKAGKGLWGMFESGETELYQAAHALGTYAWNIESMADSAHSTVHLASLDPLFCDETVSIESADPKGNVQDLPVTVQNCAHVTTESEAVHAGEYRLRASIGSGTVSHVFSISNDAPLLRVMRRMQSRVRAGDETDMSIEVVPAKTFIGTVTETIPDFLSVIGTDDTARMNDGWNETTVSWSGQWDAGKTYVLRYAVRVPDATLLAYMGPLSAKGDVVEEIVVESSSSSEVSSVASSDISSASSSGSSLSTESSASSRAFSSSGSSVASGDSSASSQASSAHSSESTSSAEQSASSAESSAVSQEPEEATESFSFFGRFLGSIFADVIGDDAGTVSFVEERAWQLLIAPSLAEKQAQTTQLELTPVQTHFSAGEMPVFRLLETAIDPAHVREDGTMDAKTALSALTEATTDQDSLEREVTKKLIEEGMANITQGLLKDSGQLTALRAAFGEGVGSARRTDVLEQRMNDAIVDSDTLKNTLADIALENEAVRESVLHMLDRTEVKDRIVESAVTPESADGNADVLGEDAVMKAMMQVIADALVEDGKSGKAIADAAQAETVEPTSDDQPLIKVTLRDKAGRTITPDFHFAEGSVLLVIEPIRTFTPGLYTLEVTIENPLTGEIQTLEQDFAWGVLALNSMQDTYETGDTARIDIAVLDDEGEIVCGADVTLDITAPDGTVTVLATADQSIETTGSCGRKEAGFIEPDYRAYFTPEQAGAYDLTLTAVTANGTRSIGSQLTVTHEAPVIITRTAATRLWPFAPSPMTIEVEFAADFAGAITDVVPEGFIISAIEPAASVDRIVDGSGSGVTVTWSGSWDAGETATFSYMYDAPNISPEFYLAGPLQFHDASSQEPVMSERRAWQIANDAASTDTLVGYWKMDETSAGSSVIDYSGGGRNGTAAGAAGTNNRPQPTTTIPSLSFTDSRALSFDGTDDVVTMTAPATSYPITITAWFRPNDNNTTDIVSIGDTGTDNNYLRIFNRIGAVGIDVRTGSVEERAETTIGATLNTWTHVTAVFASATSRTVYLNGGNAGSNTDNLAAPSGLDTMAIGRLERLSPTSYFFGQIDDVRVYNRALTTAEITALAAGRHTSAEWDGSSSTNFETGANWDINAIPDSYTNVIIADTANDPVLTTHASVASLTIEAGAQLDLSGRNLEFKDGGALKGGGTLKLQGAETLSNIVNSSTGTVLYAGAGSYTGLVTGNTYHNLSFSGAGTWTLTNALDVNGNLTITSGTLAVSSSNHAITLSGAWLKAANGSFDSGSGTVTLDGGNQTISGSTTFWNLNKTVANASTLTFAATTTQTVKGTWTAQGASGNLLSLRSSQTGTAWKIDPKRTRTLSFLDVKDSNNLNATLISCSTECTNSGNNTNWIFPITGTVYTDEGVTNIGAGKTVAISMNGAAPVTGETDASGAFSIMPANLADGDVIAVYLDGESEKAASVTRTDGQTFAGFDLYQDRLILRHETGSSITTTHLGTADDMADTDFTDFYTVTGDDLTIDSSKELLIHDGDTFAPSGNVAVTDIDIDGTFAMGSGDITVSGSWDATDGSFSGAGTATFDSPSTETLHSGSGTWQNVTFNAANGEWDMQNPMAVSGALAIAAGTLDAGGHALRNRGGTFSNTGKLKLQGGESITNVTMDTDSGEVVFTGGSSYAGLGGLTSFYNLSFSGAGTWTLNGAIVANGTLTLSGGTLDVSASSYGITVAKGWHDASTGAFTERNGTVTFTGTGTIHSNESFSGVLLNARGAEVTLGNSLLLSGNLTISGGTLAVSSSNHAITLSGAWLAKSNGSFDSGSGTVTLDGGNQTISGSTIFWNLGKSVTTASTLTFAATTTQTVKGTWTAQGASSNILSLRSSQSGIAWKIDPKRTRTLSFLDVKDSNNIDATTILCANDCTNGGGNSNWAFPITVTVYSDSGSTLVGAGTTIAIAVNGGSATTADTNASGVASFTTVGLSAGDVVTMWIDDESSNGTTVTVTNATTLGFDIYKDHLIVRQEHGASITNAHLDTADNVSDTDVDAIYTMSGSTHLLMADGTTLLVWPGSTYEPNGRVTLDNIAIRGTFAMEGNAVDVGGAWDASDGTFTGTNTVTFRADSSERITSDGNAFSSVTFVVEGDNAQWITTDAMSVTGTQAVQTPNASADTTAPTISVIRAQVITDTGAVITWTTNESASSKVVYGTSSGSLSFTGTGTSSLNLNHAVIIDGLTASTLYYYRVVSIDLAGNTATGSLASFTTDAAADGGASSSTATGGGGGGGGVYADKSKPILSDVEATNVTGSSAVVTWTTNEWANSMIKYGIDAVDEFGYFDVASLDGVTEHAVTVTGLSPGTAYRFVAVSIDRGGNVGISEEASFTTEDANVHEAAEEQTLEEELEALEEGIEDPEAYMQGTLARALEIVKKLSGQVSVVALSNTLTDFTVSLKDFAKILPPPVLSGEPKVTVTDSVAIIEWTSDELSNSLVSFAPESAYVDGVYAQTVGKPDDSSIDHSVTLTGLAPGVRYHYRVESESVLGTKAVSTDFTFVTQQTSASVLNYSYDILGPDRTIFRWRTSAPATSVVTVRPYRNGIVARESARSVVSNDLALDHELLVTSFEAGNAYEIELWGNTADGTNVSRIIAPFTTSDQDLAPLISHVQTDAALAPGKESRVQVVISWNTNEEATSRVLYQEGVAAEDAELGQSTQINADFTRRHLVLLPNLNPGALYSFRVENTDSNGQTTLSRTFTIITPRQQESIIQVILGQMEGAFGWLSNLRRP